MKNILKYIFSLSLILCTMSSCIEEFNADLGDADSNILVVEGNIYSDSYCTFYLTRSIGINDNLWYKDLYITNATLKVVGSDGSVFESKKDGDGFGVQVGSLSPNVQYSLEIEWDGATFKSEPAAPISSTEIETVYFTQSEETGEVDIMVTNKPTNSKEPMYMRWLYDETWEIHSHYQPAFVYDPKAGKIRDIEEEEKKFVGWKSSHLTNIIIANTSKFENNRIQDFRLKQIAQNDDRLEFLYTIDVRQYALSKAQYEYELARQELSDEMGGMFAPLPSELFSNIVCSDKKHRAIGYIGVCDKAKSFRLWISTNEVSYRNALTPFVQIASDEEFLALSNDERYSLGYRITNDMAPMPGQSWEWANERGVDVTQRGAKLEKPSWWPY